MSTAPDGERDTRRRYESPIRQRQAAETRERIVDAGCELVHEFESWDWAPLTFSAVAERAGVGRRTVYRHFATEQELHEAVMARLGEQSGVVYEGLTLEDIGAIGARVFDSISTFAAPAWAEPRGSEFVAEDERRKAALRAAVETAAAGWSETERARAAAALDVLWHVPSYQRLTTAWNLSSQDAGEVIDWVVGLIVEAIRQDRPPSSGT